MLGGVKVLSLFLLFALLVLTGAVGARDGGKGGGVSELVIRLETLRRPDGSIDDGRLVTLQEKLALVVSVDSHARCIISGRRTSPYELVVLVHRVCRDLGVQVVSMELDSVSGTKVER